MEKELHGLWQRRGTVTTALAAAAAEGDRSENAEYIYRKKELREIDRRIRYLQKRMPKLRIVAEVGDRNRVYFSAWVTIEDENDEESTYRIVGPDEIDFSETYISIDSPMGKALLGKTLDDEITVKTGADERNYYISKIHYS